MRAELKRTADKLAETAHLLKHHGIKTWKLCDEWSAPTVVHSSESYRKTISDLENISTDTVKVMFLDRYEQLLMQNWQAAAKFSALITHVFDQREPNREALQTAENNLLHGRRNQPRWLVSSVYSVLKLTAEYLTSEKVKQGYKLAKATGHTETFEKLVRTMFDYSTQLTVFIYDIQKNKIPGMSVCEEPYCKDTVPQLRRGRCPACYAWVRRWQQNNPEQLAPPVPKAVIDNREQIRANSTKKRVR